MEGSNNATFYIAPAQTAPRSPFAKSHARDAVCWSNANLSDKSLVKGDNDPAQECEAKPHHATSAAATPFAAALRSRSGRFRQSFRRTKRRVVQQLLVKMHSTEPSDDAEYAALRDRQLDLHEHLTAVAMHIKSFATNLVALGHGASLIGSASLQIASTGHAVTARVPLHPSGPKAVMPTAYDAEFPKSMANVESHARSLAVRRTRVSLLLACYSRMHCLMRFAVVWSVFLQGVVLTTIVASLDKKMDTMHAIKVSTKSEDFIS